MLGTRPITVDASSARRRGEAAQATARLLWTVANPRAEAATVAGAMAPAVDQRLAVDLAVRHRIGPLLWSALGRAGCRHHLGDAVEDLRTDAATWTARAHYLPDAVRHAVRPLSDGGMEPVVFKGPSLAQRYPQRGLRPMGDLDLLLPPRQHAAALRALEAEGWRTLSRSDRRHHESVLVHPDVPAMGLELHTAFDSWHERATGLDVEDVWARRRGADCMGTPAWFLDPVDELLALAVHAAKPFHCFSHLIWVADTVVVLAQAPTLDWDAVADRAGRAGCTTILAVALRQAALAGATAPVRLSDLPRTRWRRIALAPALERSWALTRPDVRTRRRLLFALPDSWPRRAVLLLGEGKYVPARSQPGHLARRAARSAWGLARLALRRSGS